MQNLVKNQGVDGKKHSISEMTVNRLQGEKKKSKMIIIRPNLETKKNSFRDNSSLLKNVSRKGIINCHKFNSALYFTLELGPFHALGSFIIFRWVLARRPPLLFPPYPPPPLSVKIVFLLFIYISVIILSGILFVSVFLIEGQS